MTRIYLQPFIVFKSNAVGDDFISLKFIKIILPSIVEHLKHIINTIFTTSMFPVSWKRAIVRPVSKVSDPSTISDYRPISLLPVLSKVFEMLARDQMIACMTSNNSLSDFQSAYKLGHSAWGSATYSCRHGTKSKKISTLVLLDWYDMCAVCTTGSILSFWKPGSTVSHSVKQLC